MRAGVTQSYMGCHEVLLNFSTLTELLRANPTIKGRSRVGSMHMLSQRILPHKLQATEDTEIGCMLRLLMLNQLLINLKLLSTLIARKTAGTMLHLPVLGQALNRHEQCSTMVARSTLLLVHVSHVPPQTVTPSENMTTNTACGCRNPDCRSSNT